MRPRIQRFPTPTGPVTLSICVLVSGLVFAEKFWHKKPAVEWNEAQCRSIVQESPWAAYYVTGLMRLSGPPQSQQMGSPDLMYTIRWRSSKAVQLAISRMKQLGFYGPKLELPPWFKEKYYVIEVTEFLLRTNEYNPETQSVFQGLGATQFSQIKDSVFLIKKNGEKIALSDYSPPIEAGGREIGGLFFFLRKDDKGQAVIVPADGEIRFVAGLLNRVRLSQKFKLKDMLFEGVLDL